MVYSFHLSSEWIISQSRIDMPSIITGGLKMQENMCKVKSLIWFQPNICAGFLQ